MKKVYSLLFSVCRMMNVASAQQFELKLDTHPPIDPPSPSGSDLGCVPSSPDYFNYYIAKENYIPNAVATPLTCYKTIKINVIVMGSQACTTCNYQPNEQNQIDAIFTEMNNLLTFTDLSSRLIASYTMTADSDKLVVDMSQWAKGVYLYRLAAGGVMLYNGKLAKY